MDMVHFIIHNINCNDYDSHTLRNGVLNALNPYYDGFEYTLYRTLEETTFNLYYMFVPRKMITTDLLHQLHVMGIKFKFVDKSNTHLRLINLG